MGEEFDGVDVGEGAVGLALADRGAYGFDDDCVTHVRASLAVRAVTGAPAVPAGRCGDRDDPAIYRSADPAVTCRSGVSAITSE
ncbi:hypothetical protein GCM10009601_52130 [Streptomyces thermospinosisporus]|uniref:Uncharacterized protein n=1 Tax=Streptomyces thermospinosisporus TaxID=161482 RepID=A0ABP4JVN6_9ACTN